MKYIEQFGTGIQRILDDCHAQRLPEPNFEAQSHTFKVVFMPGEITSYVAPTDKLSERQRKAVEYIRGKGQISRREYAKLAAVSIETAKRDLKKLVEEGVLAVHHAGRNTVYTLIGS